MTVPAATNRRAKRIFSKFILVLAISALLSTLLATTSGDVVVQVLSQKQLVQKEGQGRTNSNRVAIAYESYGYVSIKDDTGKAGFLSRASFYEYRLPRAFLKISQHKEKLTLAEAEELQFRAGLRKRPKGWDPSLSNRNVFLDEPYRDKTVDRLFKRSHRKINTSLVVGILSIFGIIVLTDRITIANRPRRFAGCCHRPRIWISKAAALPTLKKYKTTVVVLALVIFAGLLAVAGAMPAAGVTMLLRNDVFCGKRCASSSLENLVNLEVDACIDGCFLGKGGKFAVLASCLWFLVLLLVVTISAISVKATKLPSPLSKKRSWVDYFLPLAIRPDELFNPSATLPSSHDRQKQ